MNERHLFFRSLANEHPRSYWFLLSALFYGLTSLLSDVGTTLGWLSGNSWPSRLVGAVLFGGFMLSMARRQAAQLPRNDAAPKT